MDTGANILQEITNQTKTPNHPYGVSNRLKYQFIQGWNGRIQESSRASLYRHLASFRFQPYLDICNISKFRICFD